MTHSDALIIHAILKRELTFRYRRSILGVGWTLINPLMTSLVLWLVFAQRFGNELDSGQKYAPFLVAGNLIQTYLNQGVIAATNSLTDNSSLLSKISVKPHLFVVSYSLAGLVSFYAGFLPLMITCFLSGQSPSLTLPLSFISGLELAFLISSISIFLAPLIVKYQDLRNIIVFALSLSMFITPVFYPINSMPDNLQQIAILNPINSILNSLRWSFSGNGNFSLFDYIYPFVFSLIFFSIGFKLLKRKWKDYVIIL